MVLLILQSFHSSKPRFITSTLQIIPLQHICMAHPQQTFLRTLPKTANFFISFSSLKMKILVKSFSVGGEEKRRGSSNEGGENEKWHYFSPHGCWAQSQTRSVYFLLTLRCPPKFPRKYFYQRIQTLTLPPTLTGSSTPPTYLGYRLLIVRFIVELCDWLK